MVQRKWPSELLYLYSPERSGKKYKFGKRLRELCRATGLYQSLETSTMAFPAVFPQGPEPEANSWMRKTGPHSDWRHHSVKWVKRLARVIEPKAVMVFGKKTSDALDIRWDRVKHNHGQNWQTYGESEFQGIPAVYCSHLSRGPKEEARECFTYAKALVSDRS